MQRLKRRIIGLLIVAALATGLGKLALASDYAEREARSRLQTALGAPLDVKKVALGFTASKLNGVQIFEAATAAVPPAWTAVSSIDADLSMWAILTNDMGGGVVTLRDVAVTLSFDRDGRLITRMPNPPETEGAMPLVRLEGGSFTLRREGVPDETFHNIKLELKTEGDRQTLSGTIDDPDWGRWTVSGGREKASDPFALTLKTVKEIRATMPLLRRTPFVGPGVWKAVEVEGDTDCEVVLRFVPNENVHYRVDLNPHNTAVHVPAIDLRATGASGRVLVEDNVLKLSDVRGATGGGDIRVGSTIDFRLPNIHTERYSVAVSHLNPKLLPAMWRVPGLEVVEGKAEIELTLRDGLLIKTRGQGQGSLRLFRFLPPVDMYMEADGQGFKFGLGKL